MSPSKFKYERIDKHKVMLLVVDHQEGLFQLVRERTPAETRKNILAHAALGKIFSLPTILTTSFERGPNGLLPPEIVKMHPQASFVRRHGEINPWDNENFRYAVRRAKRKQVILGGITTDVCTASLALSLVEAGYTVFANSDASGTFDEKTAREANDRMRAAGVQVLSMFAIVCELVRDWRHKPRALGSFFETYLPEYGYMAHT